MTEGERKIEARQRAAEAVADWANAHGYESPVVVSYLVVAEIVSTQGRAVVWAAGSGAEPIMEDEAGLMRWQIRGLMGEVDELIREGNSARDGDSTGDA